MCIEVEDVFEKEIGSFQLGETEMIISYQFSKIYYPVGHGRELTICICPKDQYRKMNDHSKVGGRRYTISSEEINIDFLKHLGVKEPPTVFKPCRCRDLVHGFGCFFHQDLSNPRVYGEFAKHHTENLMREAAQLPDGKAFPDLGEYDAVVRHIVENFIIAEVLRASFRFDEYAWVMYHCFPEYYETEDDPEPWPPMNQGDPKTRYISIPVVLLDLKPRKDDDDDRE